MKKLRPTSLQWVLVRRLILLQAATLITFIALLCAAFFIAQPRLIIDTEVAAGLVAEAIARDAQGRLVIEDTDDLRKFREEFPHLWFVVRDEKGEVLREGDVPEAYAKGTGELLWGVNKATLGFNKELRLPEATLMNADTRTGRMQIIAATVASRDQTDGLEINVDLDFDVVRYPDGQPIWVRIIPILALVVLIMLSPVIIVMGVTTLVTTPAVVRRSLAGLVATAGQAKRIDIDNRAVQLPTEQVPTEIAPLVEAFNNALSRLGQGYDQRNRFLTDAAHELRTPIAILRTRAELLREDPESARLLTDIERLSNLAQQLLDRQVLDQSAGAREVVDLVAFARHLAADFAPLALGAGYDFTFEPLATSVLVNIQPLQIQQAVTNLLRNAIDHGGGEGTISVVVDGRGGVEIHDEGPGIPDDEHERVFQPFYRLRPRNSGAGLGLNLAREIARLHGGSVEILVGPWVGARVRLQLPLWQPTTSGAKPQAARQTS
ncbi:HAMP domain-containing sensor histidine kinase [Aminobacter sp. NyZ550]|jgi:signal transduction histidine kinase|uniref:histidine kinase n=1 Tax=Aminobacter ciceronei TaxID=150723 RepID=A0ABR6CA52_9HYPH|nr:MULTISPECIES: HAMP domain-containing sensor histidine kinase [Aminobacter]MBA8907849.1 signal transduction histidine kinase [Aminobacter ciceronei]MBA9021621.1 signal transduction histidine kinase [Aminobacter ciceronei]WAX95017.1 HAMP domain-containing sensor histidine kinase [Aminobacter sp. NyZ550]WMC98103.1 HAMP domain-containing sensor histidine kinase [Aminobacter aminovorans]